ncbi:hypothetical protein FRC18_006755 [Serendipita sp. 400]|nr:hypothetical protein FRC18_006755 [Serendipita sp. 400]
MCSKSHSIQSNQQPTQKYKDRTHRTITQIHTQRASSSEKVEEKGGGGRVTVVTATTTTTVNTTTSHTSLSLFIGVAGGWMNPSKRDGHPPPSPIESECEAMCSLR